MLSLELNLSSTQRLFYIYLVCDGRKHFLHSAKYSTYGYYKYDELTVRNISIFVLIVVKKKQWVSYGLKFTLKLRYSISSIYESLGNHIKTLKITIHTSVTFAIQAHTYTATTLVYSLKSETRHNSHFLFSIHSKCYADIGSYFILKINLYVVKVVKNFFFRLWSKFFRIVVNNGNPFGQTNFVHSLAESYYASVFSLGQEQFNDQSESLTTQTGIRARK